MARACIFCGNGALTKEHAWPRWIDGFMPARTTITATRGTVVEDRITYDPRGMRKTVSGKEFRCVCESCNNIWMSDIEGAVIPILGPMIQGRETVLDIPSQRILATWITKTCLIHAFSRRDRQDVFPQDTLIQIAQEFYKHQVPLSGTHVSIAAFNGERYPTHFLFQPLRHGDSNWHIASVLVGHFIGQILHHPSDPNADFSFRSTRRRLIWPSETEVTWPTTPVVTPDELHDFERQADLFRASR
jgi:hypothetical protein